MGTGLSALDYPSGCRVAAIDLSEAMLDPNRMNDLLLKAGPLNERRIGEALADWASRTGRGSALGSVDAVEASKALLDRGWGKPSQQLEHTGAEGKPLAISINLGAGK